MSIYSKAMDKANRLQTADIIDETDCIQETILAILEKQEIKAQKVNDNNHLFNRLKRQKKWDLYRKNKKRIEKLECHFEECNFNPHDEAIDIFNNDEKQGFNDTVELIKSKLSHDDYQIFDLYFLQDKTVRQIAKIINNSVMTTSRIINKVQNHIMRLKITEIYETRYLMTGGTCKGKWPESKGAPSEVKQIDKTGFIPATKKQFNPAGFNPIKTPENVPFVYDNTDHAMEYYQDKMHSSFKFYRHNLRLIPIKHIAYIDDTINQSVKYPSLKCYDKYQEVNSTSDIMAYINEGFIF